MIIIGDDDRIHRLESTKELGERGELLMGQMDDIRSAVHQYLKYKAMWIAGTKRDDTLKKMMLNEMSHIQYHFHCFMDVLKGSKDCEEESSIYSQMVSTLK